jgi:hypothetical protein
MHNGNLPGRTAEADAAELEPIAECFPNDMAGRSEAMGMVVVIFLFAQTANLPVFDCVFQ